MTTTSVPLFDGVEEDADADDEEFDVEEEAEEEGFEGDEKMFGEGVSAGVAKDSGSGEGVVGVGV